MKKIAFAIVAFLFLAFVWSNISFAGTKTFSWNNPTTYENGDPLNPATELQNATVYCNGSAIGTVPGGETTLVTDLPSGVYQCHATVTSIDGSESQASNSVNFIILRIPAAPSNFTHN